MMPAFVKAVLRSFTAGLALLALIAVLIAWPARHVLEPLWPGPVEELIYMAPGSETERVLEPVRRASVPTSGEPVLASSRPLSLVRVESMDGGWRHGYLLGVSAADDHSLREDIPDELLETVVELREFDYDMLVLVCAEGERFEMPVSEIHRLIYPNRLVVSERMQLALQRLADRIGERLPAGLSIVDIRAETAASR